MIQWAFAHPYLFAFCGTFTACIVALACVDLSANLVKGFILVFARKSTKQEPDPIPPPVEPDTARVTFFTPPGKSSMTHREMAEFLYSLLDDIDTASDIVKGNDAAYRSLVEKLQARKCETGIASDGHRLIFPEPVK